MNTARRLMAITAVLALCLLARATAGDPQQPRRDGQPVRVATGPLLRPFPEPSHPDAPPTLAHRYAKLVAHHSGLSFVEHPYDTTRAAIAAVCEQQADLVLVQGASKDLQLPCAGLIESRAFRGGDTVLAGRLGMPLPHDAADLRALRLAAVEGGPYPAWVAERHPSVQVIRVANMHAALMAVESGDADAAIGLEASLRPVFRRDFRPTLRLQSLRGAFPRDLHLLARRGDKPLIEQIETALEAISVDEHAALLQRWTRQAVPAALTSAFATTAPWVLPATSVILLAALASAGVYWRRRGRLEAQQRAQNHASSMVNHEVRNAAQAMVSAVDLLRQSPLPEGARELASIAASAGQSLRGLLNRALDFARMADGSFQPQPRPCDLAALCTQSIQTALPRARQKGLALQFTSPDELPPLLLDPECLRQILDNLLGNALKFTDVGGIDLRVSLNVARRPALLQIDVVDSGVGIAPAQMAELFAPYHQGDAGRERGGSGLGLSICRQLAQAMGGTLDAHSVHGRGSRFTLCLPVQALDQAELHLDAAPLAGVGVLLVEDHALNRRVVAEHLQQLGAQVYEADGATQALQQQAHTPADVVLLDVELDEVDGYALAAQLRHQEQGGTCHARLLAFSAHDSEEHLQRCRRAGIDQVLVKPLQMQQLVEALGLSWQELPTASELPPHLIADYEQDIRAELALLQAAVEARDAQTLRHHAHRLQGVLQMRGAAAMQDVAGELWGVGNAAAPDWSDAQRLLRVLLSWREGTPVAPGA